MLFDNIELMLRHCEPELLTPQILDAITEVYQTPMILYKAYLKCKNETEAKFLILDTIKVPEVDDEDFAKMLQFLNKGDWTDKELLQMKRMGSRMALISVAIYESYGWPS